MADRKITVTFDLPVTPQAVYACWVNSRGHTAMTGSPAEIEPHVGNRHSAFDGYAFGWILSLDPGERIVLTWRTTEFPVKAPDSLVDVRLKAIGANASKVTIAHHDLPKGTAEKYKKGWQEFYVLPMRRFFGELAAKAGPTGEAKRKGTAAKPTARAKAKPAPAKKAAPAPVRAKAAPARAKAAPARAKAAPARTKAAPAAKKAPARPKNR